MGNVFENEIRSELTKKYKDVVKSILDEKNIIYIGTPSIKNGYPIEKPRKLRVFVKTYDPLVNCVNSQGKPDNKTMLLIDIMSRKVACAFYNDNETSIIKDFQVEHEFISKGWKH